MHRVNRNVGAFNDLGDDTVGDVERAGLLPAWTDIIYLQGRSNQPSVAQHDFGRALPDSRDLGRSFPEFEAEGLSVTECHVCCSISPNPPQLIPENCLGTSVDEITIFAGVSSGWTATSSE
jgi:hypothetical protein